jgi:hypothetical protein
MLDLDRSLIVAALTKEGLAERVQGWLGSKIPDQKTGG